MTASLAGSSASNQDVGQGTATVRCAVVGLDSAYWPEAFRSTVVAAARAELVGVCGLGVDPDVIRRDFVAPVDEWLEERGTARTDTLDELLELDFDAAFLCTRNSVMPAIAERLLAAGKHLFVAKPMAVDAEAATVFASSDRVVTAGQLASTWEPWPTILRLIGEGRIGEVLSVRAVHQHGDYRRFPPQLWYTDAAEGDLCNWLCWYPVEAATALLGDVAAIAGVARQTASAHGAMPDQAHAVLEHVDGRVSTVEGLFTVGEWGMAMHEAHVVGDRGIIRSHGPDRVVEILGDHGVERVAHSGGDGLVAEIDAFLGAVAGEGEPLIDARRAVHVAQVCAALRESARTGLRRAVPPSR